MATSEVLIQIPSLTFNEDKIRLAPPADTMAIKVAQLEHNMRFLREQHQIMLSSLHKEIENLRQFNRELQFQLVMSGAAAKMSALSIEVPPDSFDDTAEHQNRHVNNDYGRVELLEKSLAEMRIGLNEEKGRNKQLYEVVREQQRKIEHLKMLGNRSLACQDAVCQVDFPPADQVVENSTRYTQTYRNSEYWSKDSRRSGGNRFRRHNSGRFSSASFSHDETAGQQPTGSRLQMFPPLQSPAGWQQQQAPRPKTSVEMGKEKLPALQLNEEHEEGHWAQRMEQAPHSDRNRRRRFRSKRVQGEQTN
ncbi:uncharacterized protein LOC132199460 [Neocloeon triangulifer]|uniref:uncharacterized protein LOC132199460 n=1 Tax=Neocloeon triangulifer TaxID=2078957 RepID=UPI00286F2E04|nr:uncharacterized protein LOC132199460 [Neocloeon triangulifer]